MGSCCCFVVPKLEDDKQRELLHLGNLVVLRPACLPLDYRLWSYLTLFVGREQHDIPMGLRDRSLTCSPSLKKVGSSRAWQETCWHTALVLASVE